MTTAPRPHTPKPTAKQGIVSEWTEPDASRNSPGKMIMDDGSWEVAWWANEFYVLDDVDLDNIIGKTVLFTVKPKGEYNGREQYNGVTITVQDGAAAPPSRPGKAAQGPVSKPTPSTTPSSYEMNKNQIMLQHATALAASALDNWMSLPPGTRGPFFEYIEKIAIAGTWIQKNSYIPGGYTPKKAQEAPQGTSGTEAALDDPLADQGQPPADDDGPDDGDGAETQVYPA